jgi:hypothetical protein
MFMMNETVRVRITEKWYVRCECENKVISLVFPGWWWSLNERWCCCNVLSNWWTFDKRSTHTSNNVLICLLSCKVCILKAGREIILDQKMQKIFKRVTTSWRSRSAVDVEMGIEWINFCFGKESDRDDSFIYSSNHSNLATTSKKACMSSKATEGDRCSNYGIAADGRGDSLAWPALIECSNGSHSHIYRPHHVSRSRLRAERRK